MTKDQVIAWAREAGGAKALFGDTTLFLEAFATLVRNSVLEEAAKKCEDEDVAPTDCPLGVQSCIAQVIRAMKETI
jgi:hypothetical protein